MIDAALAAHLSQNELKVFLVLLRQTLTYTKTADPLTPKRIAELSHIRKDRVLPAITGVINTQIFQTKAHSRYNTEYSINPQYLNTTTLPKNRSTAQKPEPLSEKRVHTTKTNTTVKPNTTTSSREINSLSTHFNNQVLPYPQHFTDTEKHQAAKILDRLSPTNASDCLQILNQALTTGKIQKPLAYLYQLTKFARSGLLDTSTLIKSTQTSEKPNYHDEMKSLQAEIYSIDQLFQRSQLPMDTQTANHRANLLQKLNIMKLTE